MIYPIQDSCDNCSKESVCKYGDQFKKYIEQVNQIDKGMVTPFRAIVKCDEFSVQKNTRNDFYQSDSYTYTKKSL